MHSPSRLLAFAVIASASAGFGHDAAGSGNPAYHAAHVCTPETALHQGTVQWLRHLASDTTPRYAELRDSLGLPVLDSTLVIASPVDSLCAKAAVTINRDLALPDTTARAVFLVRFDSLYWASDTSVRAGEYIVEYLLPSTLDSVLGRVFH